MRDKLHKLLVTGCFVIAPVAAYAACPTYTVKSGDTLAKIAGANLASGYTINDLIEVNSIRNPDNVPVGAVLTIPCPSISQSSFAVSSGSTNEPVFLDANAPRRVQVAAVPTQSAVVQRPQRTGLLRNIFRRNAATETVQEVEQEVVVVEEPAQEVATLTTAPVAEVAPEPKAKRRFGLFKRKPRSTAQQVAVVEQPVQEAVTLTTAAVAEVVPEPKVKRRFGLFNRKPRSTTQAVSVPAPTQTKISPVPVRQQITQVPTTQTIVVDEPVEIIQPTWSASSGELLSDVVKRWGNIAGYRVFSGGDIQWRLRVPFSQTGSFEAVLDQLVKGFSTAPTPPTVRIYTNKVIEIGDVL